MLKLPLPGRPIALALLATVLLGAALACRDSSGDAGSISGGGALLATDAGGGLRWFDLERERWNPLAEPPVEGARMLFPAASPDGQRIAYIVQPPVTSEGGGDVGVDLWVADRDGANARVLFAHVDENQQITSPQWIDDTRVLAIVQEATPGGLVYTLERFDVESGEREQLAPEVLGFAASPAGAALALVQLDDDGLKLYTADAAASGRMLLLSAADGLGPYSWPRFSPDGASIAFGASEISAVPPVPGGVMPVFFSTSAAPAFDGAPQDLWVADSAGGAPRLLAKIQEDSPSIAWSGDGARIYAYGRLGLFEITVATGAIARRGEGQFHGHVAWLPPRQ